MRRRVATVPAGVLAVLVLAGCIASGSSSPVSPPAAGASVAALAPAGATETARVVRVVDGDTIVVDRGRGNERLRYIGIDAPESVTPDTPVEFMGAEASAANAALVEGREIVLERDVSDVDVFGRLLRYAWLRGDDGWTLVNRELVRRGFANAVTFPPDVRWTDTLREAEGEARDDGAGLWGPPTPPA